MKDNVITSEQEVKNLYNMKMYRYTMIALSAVSQKRSYCLENYDSQWPKTAMRRKSK